VKRHIAITLRVGEALSIDNGRIILRLTAKSGQRVGFTFHADESVSIDPVRERAAVPFGANAVMAPS
jgi:hypothetical protein